jgi:hypothetical protein
MRARNVNTDCYNESYFGADLTSPILALPAAMASRSLSLSNFSPFLTWKLASFLSKSTLTESFSTHGRAAIASLTAAVQAFRQTMPSTPTTHSEELDRPFDDDVALSAGPPDLPQPTRGTAKSRTTSPFCHATPINNPH